MFNKMSDWCMAKDYNGAERFSDGSRPLISETKFADIVISGIPDKDEVLIGIYPSGEMCDYYYEGNIGTKELAKQIGNDIEKYINSNEDSQCMFTNGSFKEFFIGLNITDIRTQELAEDRSGNMETPEFIKAFVCLSRQNYFEASHRCEKDIADIIAFGNFAADGEGLEYELFMQWIILDNERSASPRLCIFNDAFKAIEEHSQLLRELTLYHKTALTPVQFSEMLLRLGYKDLSDKKLE